MSKESQEARTEKQDFAFIHNTEKGQVLVFKETEKVTLMLHIYEVGVAQLSIDTDDFEEGAKDKVFEALKNFETVKNFVNETLNQECL